MKRKTMVSILAGILAFIMILSLILAVIPSSVFAASSSSIKAELENLEAEAERIQEQKADLAREQAQNTADTEDIVSRKKEIDQEIKLIHDEINNTNEQIKSYNQLISDKQVELDDAQARQRELNEQYRSRIRAMEKNGAVSYWSVLFRSNSFSEFLGNLDMIADIAEADQRMMDELRQVAQEISDAQAELAEEKSLLQSKRESLDESQAELDAKSAEAAEILDELNDKAKEMEDLYAEYEIKEDDLARDIAQKEQEYNDALEAEEEARRREEEERRQQESNSGSGSSGGSGGSPSSSGWLYPLPYRVTVTCPYGWRIHPITGKESFHTGVDLGAGYGTAIYASRSGTVTTATYSDVFGNYVTINHGDGYSSLYAHMTYSVVSSGEYVTQGQLIGYVGSTGWSTGPHLHFTIYYNGSTANPMNYI